MHVPGRVARSGRALAHHAQGADVSAHGRHRRGADHVAARAARGSSQLGLPLLLAPRRDLHPLQPVDGGLRRGSGGVARMAPPRGRGRPSRPADPLRSRGRATVPGVRPAVVARVRRFGAGTRRQRRVGAVPTRRLRGGPRPAASGGARGPAARERRMGHRDPHAGRARIPLARARRRHLGGAGRSAAVRPLEGDGLGRGRSRDPGRGGVRIRGAGGPLASAPRRDARRDLPGGLRRLAGSLHADLRRPVAWTRRP